MKHSFQPSTEPLICRVCKYDSISHTDRATCDSCGSSGNCELHTSNNTGKLITLLLCMTCQNAEALAEIEYSKRVHAQYETARIAGNGDAYKQLLDKNRQIEQSIVIREDIFNAKMISIADLKKAIDDSDIENKHFELARVLDERYTHLKSVIFSARESITESENEQRAIQTHYNDLAKRLREEERAALKLKDVNYKPPEPNLKKVKAPSIRSINKEELKLWAGRLENEFPLMAGKAMSTLQNIVVAQGVKPEGAYNIFKMMLTGAK